MEFDLLQDMEILFALGLVTVVLFRRFYFPTIVGFLVTGMIAGPHALAIIKNPEQVEHMAELGVIFLLFTIGIEFSLKELMKIRRLVFIGGGMQVLLTIAAVALLSIGFAVPLNQAVFFGFIVALSSTAVVMKLLLDRGEMDSPHGKFSLGILIFQDLCVVPLMLLTPFLAGAGNGLAGIGMVLVKAAVVVAAAHFGARFIVPWIFEHVVKTKSRDLFILSILFITFGTALLTAKAGLSLALGAFIAGLAISESEYSQQVLGDIIPFRDALMSLFFVSVGMLLDLSVVLQHPFLVLSMILAIILVKSLVTTGAVVSLGVPLRIAIIAGIPLAQIGEFSFILSHVGLEHGLMSSEVYQLFLAASVGTMALTPLSFTVTPKLADIADRIMPARLIRGKGTIIGRQRKLSLSDHVIIAGYGLNGKNVVRVLKYLKVPHVILETNPFTVRTERKKGEKIMLGDASSAEVLQHAEVGKARVMVIAISDAPTSRRMVAQARQMNPRLHIIVRTRYVLEVEPLMKLGADEVIPEEFETSVEIVSQVLRTFLVPEDEIEQHVAEMRRGSYEMLRSMSRRHTPASRIGVFLSGAEIATFKVHAGAPLEGTQLREGILRTLSGATILAIKRGDEISANPDPVWELQAGDVVLVLGTPEQLARAGSLFEIR